MKNKSFCILFFIHTFRSFWYFSAFWNKFSTFWTRVTRFYTNCISGVLISWRAFTAWSSNSYITASNTIVFTITCGTLISTNLTFHYWIFIISIRAITIWCSYPNIITFLTIRCWIYTCVTLNWTLNTSCSFIFKETCIASTSGWSRSKIRTFGTIIRGIRTSQTLIFTNFVRLKYFRFWISFICFILVNTIPSWFGVLIMACL